MKLKLLSFIALLLLIVGCAKNPSNTSTRPIVLVSIPPYSYFVERIAGDTVDVHPIVPIGSNPHIFEPTPKQVKLATNAQVWFRIGEAFEKKIITVQKEQNPNLMIVDMWQGIKLISSDEEENIGSCHCHHCEGDEGKDLHIWLSPKLAKIQAKTIANALINKYPQNNRLYSDNLKSFLKDLDALDADIATLLSPKRGEAILVSHPAFAYFCKDYGLKQISIECEGKEPRPQYITDILIKAQTLPLGCVITQPQYNNKGAELIAKKLQLPIYMIDPYSSDYFNNLKTIAQVIAKP